MTIPADFQDLVDRPLIAALGTVRPDNSAQVNPMWFDLVGDEIAFTHTNFRAKFRNLQKNPSMSLLLVDPDDGYRYLELRGELSRIEDDPTGAFYVHLGKRYGFDDQQPPPDAKDRVILYMRIDKATGH
jgi:PPOX class probable F420-dependent enzyme